MGKRSKNKKKLIEYLSTLEYEDLVEVIDWVKLTGFDSSPVGYENTFQSGMQYALDHGVRLTVDEQELRHIFKV